MGKGIIAIDDLTLAQDEPVYDVYTRIRTLQYTTMLQMFSDIMDDYNASLLKYHDKCLLLLQQQRSLRMFSRIYIYLHNIYIYKSLILYCYN